MNYSIIIIKYCLYTSVKNILKKEIYKRNIEKKVRIILKKLCSSSKIYISNYLRLKTRILNYYRF